MFAQERLLTSPEGPARKKFHDPMKRSNPPTFTKLYDVTRRDAKKQSLKADRSVLQRLVISYSAGRDVDLDSILKHELLPVPLSLAQTDGTLRDGKKHILMDEFLKGVLCMKEFEIPADSTLIIDGQALVNALGRPQTHLAGTFGEFSTVFNESVFRYGQSFRRIDVVFDRYDMVSIKEGTRQRRQKGTAVRRYIEHADVPVPNDWDGFLSHSTNKADLTNFLSEKLIVNAPDDKCVVTAGGLDQPEEVLCNYPDVDIDYLRSTHEEADTRMILHCMHTESDTICIWCRDTDVLLLLMAHSAAINKEIIMKAGTAKSPKYVPVNDIAVSWDFSDAMSLSLLAFHALTGCDTTSYLAGHTKRTALTVFTEHSKLLEDLGKNPLTPKTFADVEKFFCIMYNVPHVNHIDEGRTILFKRGVAQENLPPTSDALKHHIMRAHLQTMIWLKAREPQPEIPQATDCGWKLESITLQPVLLTVDPVPHACLNLVSCSCRGTCVTRRCSCCKSNMSFTGICKCRAECFNVKDNA